MEFLLIDEIEDLNGCDVIDGRVCQNGKIIIFETDWMAINRYGNNSYKTTNEKLIEGMEYLNDRFDGQDCDYGLHQKYSKFVIFQVPTRCGLLDKHCLHKCYMSFKINNGNVLAKCYEHISKNKEGGFTKNLHSFLEKL